jgi:hypothetical protein
VGEITNKLTAIILIKVTKKEAKLRVKNRNLIYFLAKLRFALLPSLRYAIFSEIIVEK